MIILWKTGFKAKNQNKKDKIRLHKTLLSICEKHFEFYIKIEWNVIKAYEK